MNPIGANTWIWSSPLTDERLAELAPRIAAFGFDVIEMPVEQPGDWDPGRTADLVQSLGLGTSVCAVMAEGRDLTSESSGVVEETSAYIRTCVDAAARVGSPVVGGPMYAPTGRTWRSSAAERSALLRRLADNLRPLVAYAERRAVTLGIEPLNRFETSVVNTVAQAVELVELVDSPGCGITLDTFHMNIEETDMVVAVELAAPHLAHVQVCGNDRGAPGGDHIDWPPLLLALRRAGYRGPLCIESFTAENRTIATAASIWRPLAPSQDELATSGLAFLRDSLRDIGEGTRRPAV